MYKILIVDDQADTLILLRERLKRAGFDVYTADTGREGIDLAAHVKPDAILLDIMMPDINGLDMCKFLNNNPVTSLIPIIFVSARIQPEDVQAGFKAGASDYIKKPIERIELIERINAVIKQKEHLTRQVEEEKNRTFSATVVSANHQLKQPLTLISLTSTAIKRIVAKEPINQSEILNKLEIINNAVADISEILNRFINTENPKLDNYVGDIKMIDVTEKKD